MPSKMVTDREKSSRAVVAAAEVHAELLAARLGPLLDSVLRPGETAPDVALLSRLIGRLIEDRRDRLVAADDAADDERLDDRDPRRRRDAAVRALRGVLATIREAAGQLFGAAEAVRVFGLSGRLRDPIVVVRQADRLLARLRGPALTLPPARLPGVAFTPQLWVAEVEPPLAALKEAMEDLQREDCEGRWATLQKHRALAANDDLFRRLAGLLEGLYVAGGLDDQARTVRPSRRRPGRVHARPEPAAAQPVSRPWPPAEAERAARPASTRRRTAGGGRRRR